MLNCTEHFRIHCLAYVCTAWVGWLSGSAIVPYSAHLQTEKRTFSFVESSMKAQQKQDDFRWKLHKSMMTFVDSCTKAGWLSLKALRKQGDFPWKLYKNRMTFVESFQKQDYFRWKLHESRMTFKLTFIKGSTKAGWLSLKAPRKLYPPRGGRCSLFLTMRCFPIHNDAIFRQCSENIARGTTDPGYWLFNLSYLSS